MASLGKNAVGLIVGGALAMYVFAYVGVDAITQVFNADTSAWDSGAANLLPLIAIFFVLAVGILFIAPAMDKL